MTHDAVLLWIGEHKENPVRQDRSSDLVMDSVFNYYEDESPTLPYSVGELFLDNGAFTANMRGLELDINRVIFVQESLKPSKTIPLDYPFRNGMSSVQMEKFWERTAENILFWQSSTSFAKKLVPALHSWDKTSLKNNLRWLVKHSDSDYVAVGSLVSSEFSESNGFFGDRQPTKTLVDMMSLAVESVRGLTDFGIHVMGFGSSPLMLHMGYYLGIDSTDSSGHRRKAAYGNIVLPGTGERYVGNQSAKFGMSARDGVLGESLGHEDLEILRRCDCDICKNNQDQLWCDWKARAIHNEHVMQIEKARAENLLEIGLEAYAAYLDKIFRKSSLSYLWEYAKLKKKYERISIKLFPGE